MSALSLFTLHIKEWAVIKRRDPPSTQVIDCFNTSYLTLYVCTCQKTHMYISEYECIKMTSLPPFQGTSGSALVGTGSETLQDSFFVCLFFVSTLTFRRVHYQYSLTQSEMA